MKGKDEGNHINTQEGQLTVSVRKKMEKQNTWLRAEKKSQQLEVAYNEEQTLNNSFFFGGVCVCEYLLLLR